MGFVKKIFCLMLAATFAACAAALRAMPAGAAGQESAAQVFAQAQGAALPGDLEENIDYEKLAPEELARLIKSLPQTETDAEVLAYEKKVLENFGNFAALEMSLYYLGWGKDVFGQIIGYGFFYAPTNAQMREGRGAIRNAKKAYLFALLAFKRTHIDPKFGSPINAAILANFYYEGIFVKKDLNKVRGLFEAFARENFEMLAAEYCSPYDIGFAHYGVFIYWIAKDCGYPIEKLFRFAPTISFRNFYAGFFVPQDKEFAIMFLEKSARRDAYCNLVAADFYGGKFSPADKNFGRKKFFLERYFEAEKSNMENYAKNKALLKVCRYKKYPELKFEKNEFFDENEVEPYILNCLKKKAPHSLAELKDILFYMAYALYIDISDIKKALPRIKDTAGLSDEDFKKLEEYILNHEKFWQIRKENY